jgi:glutaredoxin 3
LLTKKDIPFEDIDVSDDPALREEIAQRSGQRTVPQIFIGDESIGGFMELQTLEVSGELDDLLAE